MRRAEQVLEQLALDLRERQRHRAQLLGDARFEILWAGHVGRWPDASAALVNHQAGHAPLRREPLHERADEGVVEGGDGARLGRTLLLLQDRKQQRGRRMLAREEGSHSRDQAADDLDLHRAP